MKLGQLVYMLVYSEFAVDYPLRLYLACVIRPLSLSSYM